METGKRNFNILQVYCGENDNRIPVNKEAFLNF